MDFVGGTDALALVAVSLALDLAILAMNEVMRVKIIKRVVFSVYTSRQIMDMPSVLLSPA